MAASGVELSRSSPSSSPSGGSVGSCSPGTASGLARNGVAAAGAVAGAAVCGAAALGAWPSAQGIPGAPLACGACIGGFQIDDAAQKHLAVVELVAPDDDGLEGERAFAQAGNHRLASGLDALCDRDFAVAGQKLDRTHFPQIHAHGIVGVLAGFGFLGLRRGRAPQFHEIAVAFFPFGFLLRVLRRLLELGFLRLADVDPQLTEHHQDVLDLLGLDLLRGQQRIDLVVGDVAALLGPADQLLDGIVPEIDRWAVGRGLGTVLLRKLFLLFHRIGLTCGNPERRDELAPLHSITSSAWWPSSTLSLSLVEGAVGGWCPRSFT